MGWFENRSPHRFTHLERGFREILLMTELGRFIPYHNILVRAAAEYILRSTESLDGAANLRCRVLLFHTELWQRLPRVPCVDLDWRVALRAISEVALHLGQCVFSGIYFINHGEFFLCRIFLNSFIRVLLDKERIPWARLPHTLEKLFSRVWRYTRVEHVLDADRRLTRAIDAHIGKHVNDD